MPLYDIRPRITIRNGTFTENLKDVMGENLLEIKDALELVAKTYGARRVVSNDA